jgi:hypothetical protein
MQNQTSPTNTAVFQCILWFICIPQSVLLLLNIRFWYLISGEAGGDEVNAAMLLLVCEVLVLFGAILTYWLFRQGRLVIGKLVSFIALIAHAGYMILFLNTIGDAIPDTIQPWIVSEGNVWRWNITLLMPGAFIALYVLSKTIFSSLKKSQGRWLTLSLTLGLPLVWYLFSTLIQPTWFGQFTITGWIIIASVFVTLFLAAIINAFDNLVHKEFSTHLIEKHYIVALLLGLVAPIGGLYLNRTFPFPVDFQATSVYVLTVINGLILLLKPGNTRYLTIKYFLRCLSFPFIFYFFLVFLPFLPLSLLAIIALGAGFLMLTPLVLGLFQFRVTQNEYHLLTSNIGKTKALAITFSGLLILPGYFMVNAVLDKTALDKTLEYFYAHDFDSDPLAGPEINRSAKTLLQLRDRKSDIQMPYISGFYNAVVFGDMVLSDAKITRIYQWLTNQILPDYKADIIARSDHRNRRFRGNLVKPDTDVVLEKIEQIPTHSATTQTVKLTLRNQSANTHTQYRETLHIPEGVFVTGLRLKIDNEWVNGRIFDQKTALWVFQKITEVRRDPAIIYYTTPTTLELQVYPFPANDIRELELDLEHHQKINARIKIGGAIVDLNPEHDTPTLISQNGKLAIDVNNFFFTREPYLHVILDFSMGARLPTQTYVDKIRKIGDKLGIQQVTLTAANISSAENATGQLIDLSDAHTLAKEIESLKLPERGGFWLERAIANEILRINAQLNEDNLKQSPNFCIIQGNQSILDDTIDTHNWNWLIPDLGPLYLYQNDTLSRYSLETGKQIEDAIEQKPASVVAIKHSNQIQLLPADTSSILNADNEKSLTAYNPRSQRFEPIPESSVSPAINTNWAKLATIWSDWKTANRQPSLFESQRQEFLDTSRKYSLLLPSTAFIVVESDSQWKILERKEDQSLRNNSALEFDEEQQASEPPWWILLVFILIYIFIKEKAPNRTAREPADTM